MASDCTRGRGRRRRSGRSLVRLRALGVALELLLGLVGGRRLRRVHAVFTRRQSTIGPGRVSARPRPLRELRIVQRARARASSSVFTSSIARVIGPTPPGTGVMARARSRRLVLDVAHELAALEAVHPDVDDDGALLHPRPLHQLGLPDGSHQDVGARDLAGQVDGSRVSDRDGGVRLEEHHRHRLTDDVGAADDEGPQALRIATRRGQEPHDAGRRAGPRSRESDRERAHVVRVEAVRVLARIDRLEHGPLLDAFRQRELDQDSVDGLVRVQPGHEGKQLRLCRGRGKVVLDGTESHLLAVLALAADVDCGGGIVAHAHHGEPGHDPAPSEFIHAARDLGADLRCDCLAVDDLTHVHPSRKQARSIATRLAIVTAGYTPRSASVPRPALE